MENCNDLNLLATITHKGANTANRHMDALTHPFNKSPLTMSNTK